MAIRKTPILLRPSPLSGRIMALHRYTRREVHGRDLIQAALDGKQDVTGDFDAILCESLLDPDSPDIIGILDGVAEAQNITLDERAQVRAFRERLKAIVERHNARLDASLKAAA